MSDDTQVGVIYRHAWCRQCDDTYRYNPVIGGGKNNKRIECPSCERDIYGSYNPAEYLGIVAEAADGTAFDYADWLAGDAVVQFDNPTETSYLSVKRSEYAGGFATVWRARDEPGTRSSAFHPRHYSNWLVNGVEATLVEPDRLYEQLEDDRRVSNQ